MTLARTAARLTIIHALKDATIAGNRVYDSQIVDFDPDVYGAGGKPCITILSDDDEGQALSDQNGGPPFRRYIDMIVEMTVIQTLPLDGEINPETDEPYPATAYRIIYPQTDSQTEASLDFLEYQVIRRLSADDDPKCALFRSFIRIVKTECHRQAEAETGRVIASRILMLQCDVQDDALPLFNQSGSSPFAAIPAPLRGVCEFFDPASEEYKVCAGIAVAIDPLVLPLFEGMEIVVDAGPGVDNGVSDQIVLRTSRPD